MKVVGLNGREYNIDTKKYALKHNDSRKKSKYHLQARDFLNSYFSGYSILEEVKLPGTTNPANHSALFLDFFIPSFKIGIEVHGEQHYTYCPFFHKNKAGYYRSNHRDNVKKNWCDLNKVELIIFKYSDGPEIWRNQLEHK